MGRHARYRVPGVPQHLLVRANNRVPMFVGAADHRFFLGFLAEAAERLACDVHAYVLMPNHVHLLATAERPDHLSNLVQSIGRRYVRYFNDRHARTGTLWEGRFKAAPIGNRRLFLACHRYIEMNPVRSGLAATPGAYPWSSHRHHAMGETDPFVTQHPWHVALGDTERERCQAYAALFQEPDGDAAVDAIRRAISRQRS